MLIGVAVTFAVVATLSGRLPAGGPWRQTSTFAVPQPCFVAFGLALLFPALADWLAKPFVVFGARLSKGLRAA